MITADLRSAQLLMLDMLKTFDAICQKHNLTYWMEGGTLLGAVRHGGFIPWDDDLDVSMTSDAYHKFLEVASRELPAGIVLQNRYTDPSFPGKGYSKLRQRNSLAIGYTDDLRLPYHKGICIDVFEYVQYPRVPQLVVRFFGKALMTSWSVLHTRQYLTFKTTLQYAVFSVARLLCKPVWAFMYRYCKSKSRISHVMESNVYKIVHHNEHIFPVQTLRFEDSDFSAPNNPDAYLKSHFGNYMQIPSPDCQVQHNYINLTGIPDKPDKHL